MSSSFSANQYNSAFKSQKLQNWTIPKQFKERPSAVDGHTTFIATDRGHLLPGMKAKSGSAWTSFVGTWDLPNRIPPFQMNPTARSQEGQERLRNCGSSRSTTKKTSMLKAKSTSPRQEAEAQNTDPASKSQQKVTTDQSKEQEQLLEITPAQCASPTICNPLETHEAPEPDRPPSQKSHAEGEPNPSSERPATQLT